jgi:hypothetical protein
VGLNVHGFAVDGKLEVREDFEGEGHQGRALAGRAEGR